MKYSSHGLLSASSNENREGRRGKAPKYLSWDTCDLSWDTYDSDIICFAGSNKSWPCHIGTIPVGLCHLVLRGVPWPPRAGCAQKALPAEHPKSRQQHLPGEEAGLCPLLSTLEQETQFHWQLLSIPLIQRWSLSASIWHRVEIKPAWQASSHSAPITESNSLHCSHCQHWGSKGLSPSQRLEAQCNASDFKWQTHPESSSAVD